MLAYFDVVKNSVQNVEELKRRKEVICECIQFRAQNVDFSQTAFRQTNCELLKSTRSKRSTID